MEAMCSSLAARACEPLPVQEPCAIVPASCSDADICNSRWHDEGSRISFIRGSVAGQSLPNLV
eukprot:5071333-Amphidinium_carterae.1